MKGKHLRVLGSGVVAGLAVALAMLATNTLAVPLDDIPTTLTDATLAPASESREVRRLGAVEGSPGDPDSIGLIGATPAYATSLGEPGAATQPGVGGGLGDASTGKLPWAADSKKKSRLALLGALLFGLGYTARRRLRGLMPRRRRSSRAI